MQWIKYWPGITSLSSAPSFFSHATSFSFSPSYSAIYVYAEWSRNFSPGRTFVHACIRTGDRDERMLGRKEEKRRRSGQKHLLRCSSSHRHRYDDDDDEAERMKKMRRGKRRRRRRRKRISGNAAADAAVPFAGAEPAVVLVPMSQSDPKCCYSSR